MRSGGHAVEPIACPIQPFGITQLLCFLDAADKDRNCSGGFVRVFFFVADGLEGSNAPDDGKPFVVEIGVGSAEWAMAKIPKRH